MQSLARPRSVQKESSFFSLAAFTFGKGIAIGYCTWNESWLFLLLWGRPWTVHSTPLSLINDPDLQGALRGSQGVEVKRTVGGDITGNETMDVAEASTGSKVTGAEGVSARMCACARVCARGGVGVESRAPGVGRGRHPLKGVL